MWPKESHLHAQHPYKSPRGRFRSSLSEDAVSPVSTRQARRQTQGSRAWNHDGGPIMPPALSVSGLVMSLPLLFTKWLPGDHFPITDSSLVSVTPVPT